MENNSYLVQALDHIAAHPSATLFTACLLLLYIYSRITYTYWKSRGVPQLDPSFPFGDVTSVIFRRKNMGERTKEMFDWARLRGHRYIGVYSFFRKGILLADPVLIREVMGRFNDRGIHYDEKNDPISAHLFSLAGPKWKNLRTRLTPAYSPKQLRNLFNVVMDCGMKLIEFVEENVVAGRPIEIKETFARYNTDVIGSTALGLECNSLKDPNAEFRQIGKRAFTQNYVDIFRISIIRNIPRVAEFFGLGIFTPQVTEFFRRVVRETVEYREKNNVRREDFLQILIELKNSATSNALTMDEIAAQVFIFFLAGFETTSTTTCFAVYELAMNKEIQDRARLEIRKSLEKHGGVLDYEILQEFTYLDMIVHEAMRKYPAAPFYLRRCPERYQLPDSNVVIEEGFNFVVSSLGLHRDPEYFPDPDRFDPDRFSEENRSKIWDYTYMPFGSGPRICIGMRFAIQQIKISLALLLKDYVLHINSKTKFPVTLLKSGILLSPEHGIWVDLEPAR